MAIFKSLDLARPSRQHLLGYILLAPAVLLVGAIIIYPLIISIDLSFQDVKLPRIGAARKPFTLANYEKLFTSAEFWMACWTTIKLVTAVTIGSLVVGLSTALLVNNNFKGRTMARLVMALPWAVPEIIAVVIRLHELVVYPAWLFRHDDCLGFHPRSGFLGGHHDHDLERVSIRLNHDAGWPSIHSGGFLCGRQSGRSQRLSTLPLDHNSMPDAGAGRDPGARHPLGFP